jgi:UDP-MurNAc hydroxylase
MKVQWFRSATVGIYSKSGTSILCDPWITDGAFIGSWFHWPPLEGFEFSELVAKNWDALYISHFHADHFDRKLVAKIARSNPNTKVLIPFFENKWLKRAVENCGFEPSRIIELPSNKKIKFLDIEVTIYVADYCNPEICGVSIPCAPTITKLSANDSVALFEADGQKILNANDALSVQTAHKLWPKIGKIDLLLGHFGGAGPYPQCFTNLTNEEKKSEAIRTGEIFVNRLISTSNALNSRYVMPYAGQYLLGGKLSTLNEFRSVIPLTKVLQQIASSSSAQPISLNAFGEFNLDTDSSTGDWTEPHDLVRTNYISRISSELYPYEVNENFWEAGQQALDDALNSAKKVFESFLNSGGIGSESSIVVRAKGINLSINFGKDFSLVATEAIFKNVTTIESDARLLRRLISRKPGYKGFTQYHFNQAEIGSHLSWSRVGPYPKETSFLNFAQNSIIY